MKCSGLLALSLVACVSDTTNEPVPAALVLDQPTSAQALITGTREAIRWHGGDPAARVDIVFEPTTGAAIPLAQGLPNTGAADIELHLLAAEARAGGRVRVTAAAPTGALAAITRGLGNGQGNGQSDGNGTSHGSGNGQGNGNAFSDVAVGSLAGFSWNGSAEDYYWIDVLTGTTQTVGTVGDLASWTQNVVAVDHDAHRLYILGYDGGQHAKVYTLDSQSGALVHDVAIADDNANFLGLQLTRDARLVAFRWNGTLAHEELVAIDATTGATNAFGTAGDLHFWTGETAYDPGDDRVVVLGYADLPTPTPDAGAGTDKPPGGAAGQGPLTLYELDATTGALAGAHPIALKGEPLTEVAGVSITSTGALVGFRWNGASEDMLRIERQSGEAVVIGQVDDLHWWSRIAPLNRTSDVVYVIGAAGTIEGPAPEAWSLYAMNARTGAFLYKAPLAAIPTNGVLVY